MVIALQTTDAFKVSTPADWVPGEEILVGAPSTAADMRRTMQSMGNPDRKRDVQAWFLTFKPLAADEIESRLRKRSAPKKKPKSIA